MKKKLKTWATKNDVICWKTIQFLLLGIFVIKLTYFSNRWYFMNYSEKLNIMLHETNFRKGVVYMLNEPKIHNQTAYMQSFFKSLKMNLNVLNKSKLIRFILIQEYAGNITKMNVTLHMVAFILIKKLFQSHLRLEKILTRKKKF